MLLIELDTRIYLSHKYTGAPVANSTAHKEYANAEQCHISEIVRNLQEAGHLGSKEEVKQGI